MKKNISLTFAIALIIISFLITTAISLGSLHSVITGNAEDLSTVVAGRIHDSLNDMLMRPVMVAKTMANNSLVKKELKAETTRSQEDNANIFKPYLVELKQSLNYSLAFIVSDQTKAYYTHEGFFKTLDPEKDERDIWYSKFIENKKPHNLNIDFDEINNHRWTIFVNAAIVSEKGELLGATGVGIVEDNIQAMFSNYKEKFDIEVNLVDANDLVLVSSNGIPPKSAHLNIPDDSKEEKNEYVCFKEGNGYKVTKYIEPLGWYLVVQSKSTVAKAEFFHIILINIIATLLIIIALLAAVRMVIKNERRSLRTDKLTGMKNRLVFDNSMLCYQKQNLLPKGIVALDINGLKNVNEQIGFQAGDELIKGASKLIEEYFKNLGECYRVISDEFIVVLNNDTVNPSKIHEEFLKSVQAWHGKLVDSLSISIGIAMAKDLQNPSIRSLISAAETRMGESKMAHYNNQ